MKNIKVNDFVRIHDDFQYAINLKYDLESAEKIENYILTPGALEIIEETIMSFSSSSNDRAKILIGPYGKGKSHLLLVIISMLRDMNSITSKATLSKIEALNPKLAERIESLAKDQFKLLPVVVSASSLDMKQILLNSLMESLVSNNLGNLMPNSYFDSVKKTINMWLNDYPKTYKDFIDLIDIDISTFNERIEAYDQDTYHKFKVLYPEITAGSEFNPLFASDIDTIYSDVANDITSFGYNGLFIVYDEFSKFLEGSIDKNSALDIKILQDLAELCNRSSVKSQIHLTLISHKGISSYTDELPKTKTDSWKAVSERFKRVEINNSKVQTYHLISEVISKDGDKWPEVKHSIKKTLVHLENNLSKNGVIRGTGISNESFVDMMYPMHPMTAVVLPEIAEFVAQNERTLFTFLASNEKKAMKHLVKNIEVNEVLTPEIIFDYFEDQFKKENFEHAIYKTWRSTKEICNSVELDDKLDDKILVLRIVKTLSLLQMINKYELLPPTSSIIDLCFGYQYSYEDITNALNYLINNNYVRFVSGKKHYVLRSTQSIDIKSILKETIIKRHKLYDIKKVLLSVIKSDVIYPNQYNVKNEIIRYYEVEFIKSTVLLEDVDINALFEKGHEAKYILVLLDDNDHFQAVLDKLKLIKNQLQFAVVNNTFIPYIEWIQSFDALNYLIEENMISPNKDDVLDEEYRIELDEVLGKLNDYLVRFFDPSLNDSTFIHDGKIMSIQKKSGVNNELSAAMESKFSDMPIIINEMINRDSINTTITNARNKIVEALLKNRLYDNLSFTGHGPEVSIMRTTLLNTQIYDGASKIQLKGIASLKLEKVLMIIEEFICSTSANGPRRLSELYDKLRNPENHIGLKLGVIPIYVAAVIHNYKRHLVITKDKHELELTTTILNEINKYPDRYCLYLEKWDSAKEEYLQALESIFSDYIEEDEKEHNSFNYVVKGMHRWFLYLPKYAKEYQHTYLYEDNDDLEYTLIDVEKNNIRFRSKVRPNTMNSREFLFSGLPRLFGRKPNTYNIIDEIRSVREDVDTFIDGMKETIHEFLITLFATNRDQSLYSAIHEWYINLEEETKCYKFDDGSEVLIEMEGYISNNHKDFIEVLTRRVLGLSINDWNDEKFPLFIKEVKHYKRQIEKLNKKFKSKERVEIEKHSYEVAFYDDENTRRSYQFGNNGFSTDQAHNFYDELSGVLGDYVHLDKNEARQVIMEVLKKVL